MDIWSYNLHLTSHNIIDFIARIHKKKIHLLDENPFSHFEFGIEQTTVIIKYSLKQSKISMSFSYLGDKHSAVHWICLAWNILAKKN